MSVTLALSNIFDPIANLSLFKRPTELIDPDGKEYSFPIETAYSVTAVHKQVIRNLVSLSQKDPGLAMKYAPFVFLATTLLDIAGVIQCLAFAAIAALACPIEFCKGNFKNARCIAIQSIAFCVSALLCATGPISLTAWAILFPNLPKILLDVASTDLPKKDDKPLKEATAAVNRIVKMPTSQLAHIRSFLSYRDQGRLAATSRFMHDEQLAYDAELLPIRQEIDALAPRKPLTREKFEQLLIAIVGLPCVAGYSGKRVQALKALMECYFVINEINEIVPKHAAIADLLSVNSISPDQTTEFCIYLVDNQFPKKIRPWVAYRILEHYALKPQFAAGVTKVLERCLTQLAEKKIKVEKKGFSLGEQMFEFQGADIDPREWFGWGEVASSLWWDQTATRRGIAPMPEPILEVIWARIQSLRSSYRERLFEVSMTRRMEAEVPRNFTLELAKRITRARIFLIHEGSIDALQEEQQDYAQGFCSLRDTERGKAIMREYPGAIVRRNWFL